MCISFKSTDRAGRKHKLGSSHDRCERREICNIAVGDSEGSLLGRIPGQVTGRAAARSRRMVNADHCAQDSGSLTAEVVRETQAWFDVNAVMSELSIAL